jgi:hypothetical protein
VSKGLRSTSQIKPFTRLLKTPASGAAHNTGRRLGWAEVIELVWVIGCSLKRIP